MGGRDSSSPVSGETTRTSVSPGPPLPPDAEVGDRDRSRAHRAAGRRDRPRAARGSTARGTRGARLRPAAGCAPARRDVRALRPPPGGRARVRRVPDRVASMPLGAIGLYSALVSPVGTTDTERDGRVDRTRAGGRSGGTRRAVAIAPTPPAALLPRARAALSPRISRHRSGSTSPPALHRFSGDSDDFRRWLFTIARRRQIDATRRSARRPEDLDAEAGADLPDVSSARAFDEVGALDRALALVRRLPPTWRRRCCCGLSPTSPSTRWPRSWVAAKVTCECSFTVACASSPRSSL